jgi:hypothetical protein
MSQEVVTRCNGCRKIKDTANKWIGVVMFTEPEIEMRILTPQSLAGYSADQQSRNDRGVTNPSVEDYCSDTCLQKRLGVVLAMIRESSADEHPCAPYTERDEREYKSLKDLER